MSDDELVTCGSHGQTRSTFVCEHLVGGVACGYHAGTDGDADKWPDAWCDLCDEVDELPAARIRLLCTHCYEDARARNEHPPLHARGVKAQMSAIEAGILLHHATHVMQALQDAATERWGLSSFVRWDYDDETKLLTFSDPTRPMIIADVRLVGSYAVKAREFEWSWKTYEAEPETPDVDQVRVFGEVRGITRLTAATFDCDTSEGWEMASIAGYLLGTEALYRAPMDDLHVYMLLANLRPG
ncbi:MAG TPA: hypothetical protein VGM90_25960 [Kofleriaceae bacterium]|jgi:hypothetical protein